MKTLESLRNKSVNFLRSFSCDPCIILIFLATSAFVILILFNYANCYQEAESVLMFTPAALEQGTKFSWHDFVNIFNVWGLDNGWNRPRFLSYTAYILSIKTRIFFWDFMRPHPTLSILWILTLILAPWIFYKYLKIILKEKTAALAGVAVYLSSCGYLFAGTMLMHPGKPLLNVVLIGILYLCAKNQPQESKEKSNPAFHKSVFWGVVPLLTASLFLDEMATFCFTIPIVWSIRYFLPYRLSLPNIKTCTKNILVYCIPAVILLFMVLILTPYIARHAFGKNYDFFGCISQNAHISQVNFELLSWNTLTLFSAGLLPWGLLNLRVPVPDPSQSANLIGVYIFYALVTSGFVYLFFKSQPYRAALSKVLVLIFLFIILQSLNITFHIQKIVIAGYYYGAPFSVLFAALIALIVTILNKNVRFGRWLSLILLSYIIMVQFMNFLVINISWKTHSDWKATVGVPMKNLDTVKGRVIYLIKKKLKDDLQSNYKIYYPGNIAPVNPVTKLQETDKFWKEWKNGKCDLFSQKHGMMFVQNLWLYGELCPQQFKEFYGP